jgi:hypothetical protein
VYHIALGEGHRRKRMLWKGQRHTLFAESGYGCFNVVTWEDLCIRSKKTEITPHSEGHEDFCYFICFAEVELGNILFN